MRFWKRPVVRQYFHKGLLWRASETEEVASFELFVDLLYVGIIAINGDSAVEHADGRSLLRFCITFILSWKLWSDLTMIISWFETGERATQQYYNIWDTNAKLSQMICSKDSVSCSLWLVCSATLPTLQRLTTIRIPN